MMWLIILGFIALFVITAFVIDGIDYSREYVWALLFIPIGLAIWLLALFGYNRYLDYGEGKCSKWSQTTGYETKYVNIGYGDWDCYGLVDGKWIPIDRIRGIEE